jgi:integrase
MARLKITKRGVDGLPDPVARQALYFDSELTGFGIRVSATTRAYFVEKRVSGKTVRYTIGKHGEFTADQARRAAQKLLNSMAGGANPVDEKRCAKVRGVTLIEAFTDFLESRKSLKPRTLYDYGRCMAVAFNDWQGKPLLEISRDMVQRRHHDLGEERGEAYANLSMRFLRALFNFAIGQYDDSKGQALIRENPVKRLSQARTWYRVARRRTLIKPHELAPWFRAVRDLENNHTSQTRETVRDYLLLLLFTGLRRQEAAMLPWANVDLGARTLTVTDTKNHEDHTLPLPDFLFELLQRRREETTGAYVFPGDGVGGYIVEPRKQMQRVIRESGVSFTLHDLRRTFITIAEGLDIPGYALKRLLNHKAANDVTAGYIVADAERLRGPMQKIADYIQACVGLKDSAQVIPLTPVGVPSA